MNFTQVKEIKTNIQCRCYFLIWSWIVCWILPPFFTRRALHHQPWNHTFTHMHIHPQPHDISSDVIWTLWPHWAHPVSQAADLLIVMLFFRPLGNVIGFAVIRFGPADHLLWQKATCCFNIWICGWRMDWLLFIFWLILSPMSFQGYKISHLLCAACCCDPYALIVV